MNSIVRQLAAQGWDDEAIAAATHQSVEQVRQITRVTEDFFLVDTRVEAKLDSAPLRARACDPCEESKVDGSRSTDMVERPRTAEDFGRATFERLAKQRAQQQAEAALLRAEIERLMEADRGTTRGRARRILSRLALAQPIALRTVQWHLKEIAQRRRHCVLTR